MFYNEHILKSLNFKLEDKMYTIQSLNINKYYLSSDYTPENKISLEKEI